MDKSDITFYSHVTKKSYILGTVFVQIPDQFVTLKTYIVFAEEQWYFVYVLCIAFPQTESLLVDISQKKSYLLTKHKEKTTI